MELDQAVDRHVFESAGDLQTAYRDAKPFPHVVIDDFLTPSFAQRLLDQFPSFDRGNNIGDDGKTGNKATFEKIRSLGQDYAALDDLIKSQRFLKLLESITGVPDLIYDPFYLGGGTHENRQDQSLQAHIDFNYHPSEGWHRRLNLIVYLNHDWDARWGGNLELYTDPYKDKRPQAQRCADLQSLRDFRNVRKKLACVRSHQSAAGKNRHVAEIDRAVFLFQGTAAGRDCRKAHHALRQRADTRTYPRRSHVD